MSYTYPNYVECGEYKKDRKHINFISPLSKSVDSETGDITITILEDDFSISGEKSISIGGISHDFYCFLGISTELNEQGSRLVLSSEDLNDKYSIIFSTKASDYGIVVSKKHLVSTSFSKIDDAGIKLVKEVEPVSLSIALNIGLKSVDLDNHGSQLLYNELVMSDGTNDDSKHMDIKELDNHSYVVELKNGNSTSTLKNNSLILGNLNLYYYGISVLGSADVYLRAQQVQIVNGSYASQINPSYLEVFNETDSNKIEKNKFKVSTNSKYVEFSTHIKVQDTITLEDYILKIRNPSNYSIYSKLGYDDNTLKPCLNFNCSSSSATITDCATGKLNLSLIGINSHFRLNVSGNYFITITSLSSGMYDIDTELANASIGDVYLIYNNRNNERSVPVIIYEDENNIKHTKIVTYQSVAPFIKVGNGKWLPLCDLKG